ncbi:inorganic phosphate transporter [Ascoidea rubescens DSM 1968]|uniref:Inorganic phosphate transporter n=1 Tax=Ascoidea rubescens DSM 1968 TaxID=1344418 RepID=A0A1D2VNH5_9ASCO|nr:inorganic phosphate transporter [Ascoidea rubescens DSM 1968]ODV63162.1 inorganic phosphate transporter [Ascoidea rubescens DSM 1968]
MAEIENKEKSSPTVNSLDLENGVLNPVNASNQKDMVLLTTSDIALTKKMHLINDALEEIGFTWYHFKVFCIAGFGYAADSLLGMCQSTVATYVNFQFGQTYPVSTHVLYASLLVGCVFWGVSADIIGRKIAFNTSLMLASIFSFLVGAMSSFSTYCIFLALSSFALGGNLAIDATVFLEYLPFKWQFLTTTFACWWAIGQTIGMFVAWGMLPNNSCSSIEFCPSHINRGWRYVWYINSAIVFVLACCRLFVFKLDESPKFLITIGKDEEAVALLQNIAKKYNRTCSLTVEQLKECGEVNKQDFLNKPSVKAFLIESKQNIKELFSTKLMARNTILLFLSWFLIGICYSLYANFLPVYLATRGATTSASTIDGVYGDSTISTFVSIFGPALATLLILTPKVGRRGALCVGGLSSMVFLFAYTSVRTRAANVGFACASYICIYIYYGCLYGFTPEVLPSTCRATGSSLSLVMNRAAGIIVPVIAYYGDTSSAVPIWVCGAAIGVIGLAALLFPFEPSKQRAV